MTDEKSKLVYSTGKLISRKERPVDNSVKPEPNPAQQKSPASRQCDCPARTEAEGREVCYSNRGSPDSRKRQGGTAQAIEDGLGHRRYAQGHVS